MLRCRPPIFAALLILIPGLLARGSQTALASDDQVATPMPAQTRETPKTSPSAELHAQALKEIAASRPAQALDLIDRAIALRGSQDPENVQLADLLKEKILLSFDLGKTEGLDALADRMLAILMRYRAYDDRVDFHGPVLAVATEFEKRDRPKEAAKLLEASLLFSKRPVFVAVRAAQEQAKLGENDKARSSLKLFFKACARYEDELCTSAEKAEAHVVSGDVELGLGHLKEAEKQFKHVGETSPGSRSSLPAAVRVAAEYGLGEAARLTNRATEARARFERALKESSAPDDVPLRAFGLSGLARVAADEGDFAEAEKNAEEAYAIRLTRTKDGDSAALAAASSASLLGGIELRLGKLDEAEKLLLSAQKIYAEKTPADSPESLAVRFHLALLLHARGEPEKALLALGQLSATASDKLGSHPLLVALAHLEIGKIELDLEYLFDAEAELRDTLALTAKNGAEEAETSLWLGIARMRRGDYPSAVKRIEIAIESYEKLFGATSAVTVRARTALGECLTQMEKYKAARPVLERALETTSAKNEIAYATAQTALAELDLETGKAKPALELFQSALEIRKKTYGDKHVLVARCLSGLGRAQAALGDTDKGIQSLEQAVAIREASGLPDTWQKGQDYRELASLYEKSSKPELALAAYRKSVETFRRSYAPEYPSKIQQAIDGLVRERSANPQAKK